MVYLESYMSFACRGMLRIDVKPFIRQVKCEWKVWCENGDIWSDHLDSDCPKLSKTEVTRLCGVPV